MTKILIKKLDDNAVLPKYETKGSSGMDLKANIESPITIKPGEKSLIPTGIAVSIPEKYELQIRPRSGLAIKHSISVLNTPGTIDSDYRGEIKVIIINHSNEDFKVTNGLRIAQMVLCPIEKAEIKVVTNLDETTRGGGGFGSTGN